MSCSANGAKSIRVKIRLKGAPPAFVSFGRTTDAGNWVRDAQ
jgi:hypothetical protein